MSATRILRTSEARQDLLDVWSYIAGESSRATADAFVARISVADDRSFMVRRAVSLSAPISCFMNRFQKVTASWSGGSSTAHVNCAAWYARRAVE